MPLSGITTNITQGGIGRRAPSRDKVSGILWYSNTLPSGFDTDDRIKLVYTLQEAEALGILSTVSAVEVLHYHVSEFFRINPEGELWIGIFAVPASTYDFTEITLMRQASNGDIRNLGIYANLLNFSSAQITTIQGVLDANLASGGRMSVLYAPNFPGATDWTAIANARALNAPRVTTIVVQDGGGRGDALFASKSFTISALGAALGAVSKARVNQSIGNPQNFNLSNAVELETVKMASGTALVADATLAAIKDKGYLVARKYTPRISGTYFERVPTSVSATSDYAWIEFQRTVDKAVRLVETILTPTLQSGIQLKADGSIREDVAGYFKDLAGDPLVNMKADGEISNYEVLINPAQNISQTSTLVITIRIQPTAIAEFINVNIGLTAAI
jgi:hypothetical protein